MTDTRAQVLIAGGGPAGLGAAIELGRRGVRTCLVEPRITVDDGRPRAKTTSIRTMEHLRRWGLADRLRAAASMPVAWSQDVIFCTSLLGTELTRFCNAFGLHEGRSEHWAEAGQQVPQPIVERVLRKAVSELATVDVLVGHTVTAIDHDVAGVRATVSSADGSSSVVEADYLLGCDGAGGISRAAIGATYTGASGERPNLNIVFRAPELARRISLDPAVQYWIVSAEASGLMGRLDLEDQWWAIVQHADTRASGPAPEALVRSLIGGAADDLEVQVIATDRWVARMMLVDRYQSGRVFLVGDAAHLNPPWGGHGYNTCVGDAVNIAWKLAAVIQGWGGPELLRSYEAERRPVAAQTIADSAAQDRLLAPSFTDADNARLATALQAKRSEFHSEGLVLGYHYAGSPVIVDDGSPTPAHQLTTYHPSTRPGTRLPHTWLPDGRSLYDLLGEGFTLLRLSETADPAPLQRAAHIRGVPLTLLDLPELDLADRYGAPLLLIRPDQHIAWRGDATANAVRVIDTARGALTRRSPARGRRP
ncbi:MULTISPECIES: FAD-dependent monooxygenase, partial [Streptomyces]|uniref:2-polyprenyl-6-methoxyphenol hydroxylase n=1 Tax=Streptomyces pseudovenezuelae TaxID=67350 RepID=A0A124H9F9_9ACTN